MKTITEFNGFVLSDAFKKMDELAPRPAKTEKKPHQGKKNNSPKAEAAAETAVAADAATPTETPATETTTEAPAVEAAATETATAETTEAPKNDVKTAMGEAFKLEGDKLDMFMAAVESASGRRANLKRVIVMTLNEGEKAPQHAVEKDGKYYLAEYFYQPAPARKKFDGKGGKFGGKGKRGGKGGKGRGGRGDNRGEGRGPGAGGERSAGGGKPFRGPRKDSAAPAAKPQA